MEMERGGRAEGTSMLMDLLLKIILSIESFLYIMVLGVGTLSFFVSFLSVSSIGSGIRILVRSSEFTRYL
jgi:hypothetical protein